MKLETKCLHAGYQPDPTTNSRAVPLYKTSSYVFNNTEHAANLFGLRELGNIYTRLMNPTTDVLEQRVAALEGGAAGLGIASGTSAVFYSIINVAEAGDEIVSANNLYGGTYTQFNDILPKLGIKVNFVDPNDPQNFAAAITPKTKALFCESVSNPGLDVADLEAISKIANDHGIPDCGQYLFHPLPHPSDRAWCQHRGPLPDEVARWSGQWDWWYRDRLWHLRLEKWQLPSLRPTGQQLPRLALGARSARTPCSSRIYITNAHVPLRNLGACISPDNSWQFIQGIETLPLRMERHCENALTVAKHLKNHSSVEWARFPGLEDDPNYSLNQKYLEGKGGSMVVFGIKGGAEAGSKFIDNLKLFSHLANVGDARSLAIHPATTTHSQLTEDQQRAGGITPELIRLSVGIEHADDLLADLDQALAIATA